MAQADLVVATIAELGHHYRQGEISPVEATRVFLDRIATIDPTIAAFIAISLDAGKQAELAEAELRAGHDRGPLHGIPIAIKDNIPVAGMPNTAGSTFLAHDMAPSDAPCVERLRRAGAVMLGKTNLHEFACGGTTQNPFYGGTRNPWNIDRIPGGSSGGSAAAVAAAETIAAVGSDTGSSIRLPAAMCGIVGMKPTAGRVSIRGAVPLAWSCDHIGPMTKSVTDAALMLNALAGFDHLDPGSREFPEEDFTREIEAGVRGLRIGYVLDDGRGPVEAVVTKNTMAALDVLAGEGAQVEAAMIDGLDEAVDIQHTIVLGELGRTHRDWFAEHEADYGEDVRGYVAEALRLPAVVYVDALQRQRSLQVAFRAAFTPYDAVVTPAGPFTAPPIGQSIHAIDGAEVEVARHLTRFFAAFNLTGQPAIVLPSGFSLDGLPTGIQIVTKYGQDALALRIARAYERAAGKTIRVPI